MQPSVSTTVGILSTDGAVESAILSIPSSFAGAALAPWYFDLSLVAIAAWDAGLRLLVVDPRTGAESMRSEPVAMAWSSDTQPAMFTDARGAFIATLTYGDAVPVNGMLEVIALDARAAEVSRIRLPVVRVVGRARLACSASRARNGRDHRDAARNALAVPDGPGRWTAARGGASRRGHGRAHQRA